MNNPSTRAAARNVGTSYPRQGMSVNRNGCGQVPIGDQWVLLSSYYERGGGSKAPGSTLHTPTARFRVLASSRPTAAVTIWVDRSRDPSQRCNYSSGADVVVANSSGGFYGTLDSTPLVSFDIPANEFVLAEEYGEGMYTWNKEVYVSANVATAVHCRIRASVWLANGYITLNEDPSPESAFTQPAVQQRWNQAFAGTGAGSKFPLGPSSSQAFALYTELPGSEVLEYALPFKMRCDITSARDISIRWYDPDSTSDPGNASGTDQPAGDMYITVYRESDGAVVLDQRIPNGNDVYGETRLNIQPNTTYTIVYYNVSARNGVQVWMPYSEVAAANGVNCRDPNQPPTVTGVSADCNTYRFTVNDPDGDRVSLSLLVDDAAVSGATFNLTGRTANNSVYSFPTDSWRDFGVHKFEVRVNDGSGAIDFAERNVGPCLRVACSLGAVGDVEVNRQFSVSPTFRVQNRSNGASSSIGSRGNEVAINSINVTAGGVTRGATVTGTVPSGGNNTINRGESTITSQASGFVASTEPGTITITASMSTNDGDANASCGAGIETEISALPYMQSFRGDVVAGYGWKATDISVPCTNDADVLGFVDNGVNPDGSENTGSVVGSGTQMAVFARGAVEGFRSAITETNKNTRPWERIFANAGITVATNGINSDNRLGGNFEANLCAENWFADMERSTPSGSISGNQNITSLPEGTSYYNVGGSGTVTLYSSGPVTGYRRIFINGNVRLGRNNPTEKEIVYSTTGWNSVNDIPMLQVIVTGNIWIDDSIEKIDGIIVASDTIYTCAATNLTSFPTGYAANNPNAGAQSNYLKNNDNSNCYTNPLTVNGALLANKIEFWRTGGSISNASPSQDFNAPATIAERFRLPPEVFVAPRQGETSLNGDDGEKYFDSLISLPPVF